MRRYAGANISIRRDSEQLASGLRLRWRVIRLGQYPPSSAVHLVRPVTALLVPPTLRNWVRRRLLRRSF
jgi:hypothetical protein